LDKNTQIELYKAEHDECVRRYEDIYKAIWTQFNYFIVVAGAALGFGKEAVGVPLAGLVACLALIFWYWATFEPLNRYGDQVARRAAILERILNKDLFLLQHWTRGRGLRHFILYEQRRDESNSTERVLSNLGKPVIGYVVPLLAVFLITFGLKPWDPSRTAWSLWATTGLVLLAASAAIISGLGVASLIFGFQRGPTPGPESKQRQFAVDPLAGFVIEQDSEEPNASERRPDDPPPAKGWKWLYVAGWLQVGGLGLASSLWVAASPAQSGTRATGAIVVGSCVLLASYLAPLLFFGQELNRSVRTTVRCFVASLQIAALLLAVTYVNRQMEPGADKPKAGIDVSKTAGKVTINDKAPNPPSR